VVELVDDDDVLDELELDDELELLLVLDEVDTVELLVDVVEVLELVVEVGVVLDVEVVVGDVEVVVGAVEVVVAVLDVCSQRSNAPPTEPMRQQRMSTGGAEVVVDEVVDVLVDVVPLVLVVLVDDVDEVVVVVGAVDVVVGTVDVVDDVVDDVDEVVVAVVVVVVPRSAQGSGEQLPDPNSVPPTVAHSSDFSSSQVKGVSNAPPGEVGTQHWMSTRGRVVVVVVVTTLHGSGSQVPGPATEPPNPVHSSGFRSSQVSGWSGKAPSGEVGRQHCTSSSICAGVHPCTTASHQLVNRVAQAVP
jgi:hypothetical protein